ncbi:hypothetical protein Pmani_011088 [Petrolisthes manimaculis]|uniref:Uncharacterized protein n=1 Tax=Petrolisthes manimaculis TaxID=1843537 RepID=A0AAE1Q1Q5_9EUCA|nr:hypothetical protein Pmani_011088 [Petrolisthes manimaculis]
MKFLVALAVLGVCSASYQATNYGHGHSHGHYGVYTQPRWTGPVAATVPAGVGGKIVQVPDTYEVSAARNQFFRAYNDQLATISSQRYGTPNYGRPYSHGASVYRTGGAAPSHSYSAASHSFSAPVTGYAPAPVRDTPEVAAAKAQFFSLYERQAAAAAAAPDHYVRPSYHY